MKNCVPCGRFGAVQQPTIVQYPFENLNLKGQYGIQGIQGFGALGKAPIAQDLVSATAAFGIPFAYDRYAKKKHKKRYGRWANVGAAVGIYFLTSFAYGKLTA